MMDRDTARTIVSFAIVAGVTWWMWRKGREEQVVPKHVSEFQLGLIRDEQPRIKRHLDRLRNRQRIPW